MSQALPSREDWETLLKKEGCKGGMSATIENWEDMRAEHIAIAGETPLPPKDANHAQQAKKDLANLTKHVIYATKRKTVPQNSLPTEILVALLAPNYILRQTKPALHSTMDTNSSPPTHSTDNPCAPIRFVPGPAFPAADGRPDFHHSTYKPPKLRNPHTKCALTQMFAHIYIEPAAHR